LCKKKKKKTGGVFTAFVACESHVDPPERIVQVKSGIIIKEDQY